MKDVRVRHSRLSNVQTSCRLQEVDMGLTRRLCTTNNVPYQLVHAMGSSMRELHNTVFNLSFDTRYLNHHGSD